MDDSGDVYVTGWTDSADFPTTAGGFNTTFGGGNSDVFVAKLNRTGSDLVYASYLGGNNLDEGYGIAVDDAGNAYVTGRTWSSDFPTTTDAFQRTFAGSEDAFVVKLNSAGSDLIYSTYLGGEAGDDGKGIAVDGFGNAYVTGGTWSSEFPTTLGALDTTCGGGASYDAFVTKLDSAGSDLIYSTYLGGEAGDNGIGITVDDSGSAYVIGSTSSSDFPTTVGAFDRILSGFNDLFVSKLNASGTTLVYSTFLGGNDTEHGSGIVVDNSGNAYVTGWTTSSNFPTTVGAFDTTRDGPTDGFVVKLNITGSTLVYSTYLGGTGGDGCLGIALDDSGDAYVTGVSLSTDFPTTSGAFDRTYNNSLEGGNAFLAKVNDSGNELIYSTYLGGDVAETSAAIALDISGDVYVTGNTFSSDFPTTVGAFDRTHNSELDVFVAKLRCVEVPGEGEDQGEQPTPTPTPTPTPAPSTNIFNFVCPTASATASTALAVKLDRLREWRDGALLVTRFGETVARMYYAPRGF